MSTEFAVFVTQPVRLDYQCFQLWVKGHPVEQAISLWTPPQSSSQLGIAARTHVDFVRNQFQTLDLLEHYLEYPNGEEGRAPIFTEQTVIRLPPHVQSIILDSYYALDDAVLREMMGKKLSSRLRKDLEVVAEESNHAIQVQSCRRQFDNVKRVFREVEDMPGHLPELIQKIFLVSPELARRYAHLVFLAKNRVDTTRKRLALLTFGDIDFCAGVLMENWTGEMPGQPSSELDTAFIRDIAEVKTITSHQSETLEEYRLAICTTFEHAGRASVAHKSHIKQLIRTCLHLGAGLRLEKEFKDLLFDIADKIIEPSKKIGWSTSDFELFFTAFTERFSGLRTLDVAAKERYASTVARFARVLSAASIRMYRIG